MAPIASFLRWKELGRSVTKGQEGVVALDADHGPSAVNRSPTTDRWKKARRLLTLFRLAPRWFSLDQTEGEDYIRSHRDRPSGMPKLPLTELGISQVPFGIHGRECAGLCGQNGELP